MLDRAPSFHSVVELVTSQIQNQSSHVPKNRILPTLIASILITSVIPILVTAPEAFAEIVLILVDIHIIAIVAEGGVLERVSVLRIKLPTILAVCQSGSITFIIAVVDCPLEQVRAVLIQVIVVVVPIVTVNRRTVIVIVERLQSQAILPQALPVSLFKAPLVHTTLLLIVGLALLPLLPAQLILAAELILTLPPQLTFSLLPRGALLIG